MKSPRGYWHLRNSTKSVNYRSGQDKTDLQLEIINKRIALSKEYQISLSQLQKRAQALELATKKILKIEQFYQLMCSGQLSAIGIRCYEHNNQLILYCTNDHKLLCANCMYYNNIQSPINAISTLQAIDKNNAEKSKKNYTNSKHSNHDVRQIAKAARQINSDLGKWLHQYREEVTFMTACKLEWEKHKQIYEDVKKKLLGELDKDYDRLQMQLSKLYLQTKKELNDISLPYTEHLDKIIESYKTISKLIIPNRYPMPTAKQSWLTLMKSKIFSCVPMRVEDVPDTWLKVFTSHSKVIIRKFGKGKFTSVEDS